MQNKQKQIIVIMCLSLFMLQGCAVSMVSAAKEAGIEFLFGKDVNLTASSYGAADFLVQQAETYIEHFDLIKMEKLVHVDAPDLTSDLASVIPEQVGARLIQLGYRMDVSEVATEIAQTLPQDSRSQVKPDHIVTGTYRIIEKEDAVRINLRFVTYETARVIGTFQYHIPYNSEIKKLAEPRPRIFITRQPQPEAQ